MQTVAFFTLMFSLILNIYLLIDIINDEDDDFFEDDLFKY
jgi:hypothetical protein